MSGIFGGNDRQGPIARVRYTQFKPKEERPEPAGFMKSKSAGKKHVSAPSGHMYAFRQRGEASEWLNIAADRPQDLEFFEEDDRFEVNRL